MNWSFHLNKCIDICTHCLCSGSRSFFDQQFCSYIACTNVDVSQAQELRGWGGRHTIMLSPILLYMLMSDQQVLLIGCGPAFGRDLQVLNTELNLEWPCPHQQRPSFSYLCLCIYIRVWPRECKVELLYIMYHKPKCLWIFNKMMSLTCFNSIGGGADHELVLVPDPTPQHQTVHAGDVRSP